MRTHADVIAQQIETTATQVASGKLTYLTIGPINEAITNALSAASRADRAYALEIVDRFEKITPDVASAYLSHLRSVFAELPDAHSFEIRRVAAARLLDSAASE